MFSELLTGALPEEVICDGKSFPIATDFTVWVQIEIILLEEKGNFLQKLPRILALCYPVLPDTLEDAVRGIATFYMGQSPEKHGDRGGGFRPVYSFKQDAAMIYAGFYQQYGIDLLHTRLHWFQFKALLQALGEETLFGRVVRYRAIDLSDIKSKEQRDFYGKMKKLYPLKICRGATMNEQEISDVLENLF